MAKNVSEHKLSEYNGDTASVTIGNTANTNKTVIVVNNTGIIQEFKHNGKILYLQLGENKLDEEIVESKSFKKELDTKKYVIKRTK